MSTVDEDAMAQDPAPLVRRLCPAPAGAADALAEADLPLRPARPEDLPRLRALQEAELPGAAPSAADVLDPAGPCRVLVCPSGEEIAGYVAWREDDASLHVEQLAVHAVARRHGIGRALVDAAQQLSGLPEATSRVPADRADARAFFAALGFSADHG